MNGQAARLLPVPEPKIPLGDDFTQPEPKVFDASGDTYRPQKGAHTLMARIDVKGNEEITLRRSTLWFTGTFLVLAGVVFSYGTSAIGWVRSDESVRVRLAAVEVQQTELNSKLDRLLSLWQEQAVQKAKEDGYKLGVLDNSSGHAAEPKEKK